MKPALSKGTRDFLPHEMVRRDYIFSTIKSVFRRYGFVPIETPAMERLETLTGKYGEEGDQLLFKVLNNGDFLRKVDRDRLGEIESQELIPQISKRGLRYDLTVPFARFVVMNQNELSFPFKRYQIQPVWRADRPQKGRYQEFYQCDADVIGSESLMYEAEFIQIYDTVFSQFKLPVEIRVNHRKILAGIADQLAARNHFIPLTVAIDKWDKIGTDGVKNELATLGLRPEQIEECIRLLQIEDIDQLASQLHSDLAQEGIREMRAILSMVHRPDVSNTLRFMPSLARGLSYYTGCIFEVTAQDATMGSLGGGGRYADLTAMFGLSDMSGVGISFGAERIYDVLVEKELFPSQLPMDVEMLFTAFDEDDHRLAIDYTYRLRKMGLRIDVYPETTKMKKQMKYANQRNVPFVALIGSVERENQSITVKHMESGTQLTVPFTSFCESIDRDEPLAISTWFATQI